MCRVRYICNLWSPFDDMYNICTLHTAPRCLDIVCVQWGLIIPRGSYQYFIATCVLSNLHSVIDCFLITVLHSRRICLVWWAILPSKIASGEVGVWLPWWCPALVLPAPGYWRLFLNLIIFSLWKFYVKFETLKKGQIS